MTRADTQVLFCDLQPQIVANSKNKSARGTGRLRCGPCKSCPHSGAAYDLQHGSRRWSGAGADLGAAALRLAADTIPACIR